MKDGFYSKKSVLGVPNALILLMLVFFFVPFAGRGARMALQKTENNVKDWLPADFRETEELAWFAKRFVSEQFIVATWKGSHEDDQRLKMFVNKLRNEQSPTPESDTDSETFRARKLGAEYALFNGDSQYNDWGGKNEKWLVDEHGTNYFITPNGRLHRWDGNPNIVGAVWRMISRATGRFRLDGQFVAAFGKPGTDQVPNPFWTDPKLITAPLFKTIETGPDLVTQLAGLDGPLATPTEPTAGKRDAIARLTGTMFGPPVPVGFRWTNQELPKLLDPDKLAELPEGWEAIWDLVVQREVDTKYHSDFEAFRKADPVDQSTVWYDFFDAVAVSEPQRQTSIVLTLSEVARRNLGRVIGRGMMGKPPGRLFEIGEECGIASPPKPTTAPPPFSWLAAKPVVHEPVMHIGGPPVDNVAIDEEGTITLVRLIGYSLALGIGLSLVLLRSARLMMMVFFVGGVSALASLSLVWWCNASIDAILLTMPSLVYVLGLAGAVHIINYYRDAVSEHGQDGAPERAIAHAVMPCTLAALTTAIGLLSLCSSNILPIRKFGIFSAMGVMATLVLLYIYLPSALTIFPPKLKSKKDRASQSGKAILNFWEFVGAFILRRHWWVNAACVATFVILGLGLFKIKTSVQLLKLFDSNSQIIQDYAWLEENFGRLVPMELVVRFPPSMLRPSEDNGDLSNEERSNARSQLSLLERAEAIAQVERVLQAQFGYSGQNIVGRGMSAVTFMRDFPDPARSFSPHRSAYNRKLQSNYDQLLKSDYLAIESDSSATGTELWRISLRLGALNDVDYGEFVSTLRSAVEPVVTGYRCRQEVIRRVLENSHGQRIQGNVLILGVGPPGAPKPDAQLASDATTTGDTHEPTTKTAVVVDDATILAETLANCLTISELGPLAWHDPVRYPLDEGKSRSDKWAAYVKQYDSIVLLKANPDYDMDFIRQHNPNIIDASAMLDEIHSRIISSRFAENRSVEMSTREGEMDVVYTGVVPVVYKAQRTLLVSLIQSVAWAFVLIAFVMACLLSPARTFISAFAPANVVQGLAAGFLSMIPNIFPVVIIFGIMGHAGSLVDIGSMMTASVAMGVAVDDTIHFLTWFRDGLRRGLDRHEAIFVAYKHVAPAMTQTTIIGGLGLSVFALSTFTPTQRFGTLMLALLGAALVGDLIFLPALLASPLGKIFTVRAKKPSDHDDSAPIVSSPETIREQPADEYQLAVEDLPEGTGVREPHMLRQDHTVRRRV